MEITRRTDQGHLILELEGEIDAASALKLDDAITDGQQEGDQNILLDCTRLTYISSAGLGVLIAHLKDLEERNRRILLFAVSEQVKGVLRILGLDELLDICETEDEAVSLSLNTAS